MGKPKFSRKKYETPSHPWQEDRIKEENELIKKYGLKNKREIWKAETRLRRYRSQARELLAKIGTGDVQSKKESDQLLMHLSRMNILPDNSTLDDVLALNTEDILSRKLQTLTYLKGLASTPSQARQLIAHGHIAISGRKVTVPGYMVTKEEESEIGYTSDSPLNDPVHPARPHADFKSFSFKKEEVKPSKKPAEEKPIETPDETIEQKTQVETPVEKTEEQTSETDKEEKMQPATEETVEEEKTKAEPVEKTEETSNKVESEKTVEPLESQSTEGNDKKIVEEKQNNTQDTKDVNKSKKADEIVEKKEE